MSANHRFCVPARARDDGARSAGRARALGSARRPGRAEGARDAAAPATQPLHRTGAVEQGARVVDDLIAKLRLGWISTVAFVVLGEARWTLPLYEVAITTARRGWSIGIADARYWFITPEPVPLAGFGPAARAAVSAGLEPEGVTFIGSTFADLRPNVVLLDPQGERLEVDRVVTLSDADATSWSSADSDSGTRRHSRPPSARRFSDTLREAPPAAGSRERPASLPSRHTS